MYHLIRPLLFRLDPELSHDLTLAVLSHLRSFLPNYSAGAEAVTCLGMSFPNRVGLAAGIDKNGIAVSAFERLGFGFIEVGTVTPRPQRGNPKPRLFRLPEAQALINRMGFNNLGVDALCQRLARQRLTAKIGINLGKNKDTPNENALADYLAGMNRAYALADYLAVNISSPNTVGLRDLQEGKAFFELLKGLKARQAELAKESGRYVPLLVKIAPDNDSDTLEKMLDVVKLTKMDGIIACNTTIDKNSVAQHRYGGEEGGLSGAPLSERATKLVALIRTRLPEIAIIATGGVMSADDYRQKRKAGADLVQLCTGLVYHGPQLIRDCLHAEAQL